MIFKKIPNILLIVDDYNKLDHNLLFKLCEEYKIPKFYVISDGKAEYTIKNSKNITKWIDYPDLIIKCSNVLKFWLEDPLVLFKAEIWHERKIFCREVFINGLKHYSNCVIRNGK